MNQTIQGIPDNFLVIGGMTALIWTLFLGDEIVFGGYFKQKFAIYPLGTAVPPKVTPANGFVSFFTAPLFHGNLTHLIGNTLPLIAAAWFVLVTGFNNFLIVTLTIILLSGLAIKVFGRAPTLGISGVVMGYFGYVLTYGFFTKNPFMVACGSILFLLAFLFFEAPGIYQGSGIREAILPRAPHISFVGHLSGFLSGIFAAWLTSWLFFNGYII